MKELIKVVAKKLFIYSIIFNILYSIADYGEAFALSYFGKSPLTLDKLIKLAICIAITHLVMLVKYFLTGNTLAHEYKSILIRGDKDRENIAKILEQDNNFKVYYFEKLNQIYTFEVYE